MRILVNGSFPFDGTQLQWFPHLWGTSLLILLVYIFGALNNNFFFDAIVFLTSVIWIRKSEHARKLWHDWKFILMHWKTEFTLSLDQQKIFIINDEYEMRRSVYKLPLSGQRSKGVVIGRRPPVPGINVSRHHHPHQSDQSSFFLSDPSPIIGNACHSLTHSLTDWLLFSKLDWCDPGVWRCQLKTCWGCYCCWCW